MSKKTDITKIKGLIDKHGEDITHDFDDSEQFILRGTMHGGKDYVTGVDEEFVYYSVYGEIYDSKYEDFHTDDIKEILRILTKRSKKIEKESLSSNS